MKIIMMLLLLVSTTVTADPMRSLGKSEYQNTEIITKDHKTIIINHFLLPYTRILMNGALLFRTQNSDDFKIALLEQLSLEVCSKNFSKLPNNTEYQDNVVFSDGEVFTVAILKDCEDYAKNNTNNIVRGE